MAERIARAFGRVPSTALRIFASLQFCFDVGAKKRFLAMLTRISNLSQKNAYLLSETLSVEIEKGGRWYKTEIAWVPNKEYITTDFTETQKVIFGVEEIKLLKRFEAPIITYDQPLTRYIVVTHKDEDILEHIDAVRIQIRDCHKKLYKMEVNLKEQRKKYDPDYHPDKP